MNAIAVTPVSMATDGYINQLVVTTTRGISGGSESKRNAEAAAKDDDEILAIIERIFGGLS